MLVSEIVLCTKEVNKRTRAAAYELLVGLARTMHQASPPEPDMGLGHSMGEQRPAGCVLSACVQLRHWDCYRTVACNERRSLLTRERR